MCPGALRRGVKEGLRRPSECTTELNGEPFGCRPTAALRLGHFFSPPVLAASLHDTTRLFVCVRDRKGKHYTHRQSKKKSFKTTKISFSSVPVDGRGLGSNASGYAHVKHQDLKNKTKKPHFSDFYRGSRWAGTNNQGTADFLTFSHTIVWSSDAGLSGD